MQSRSSTGGTTTEPGSVEAWFLTLSQLMDSSFPTGSFSHTYGLETYFQDGRVADGDALLALLGTYLLEGMAENDAVFVHEAHGAALEGDLARLRDLDELCHATRLTAEVRSGSAQQGRQFLRSVCAISDDGLLDAWRRLVRDREVACHYPVVFGIHTARAGAPVRASLAAFLQAAVSSLALNAVRAIPLGQLAGVEVVHRMAPVVERAAGVALATGIDEISNRAVGVEIASMGHERLRSRLFIS